MFKHIHRIALGTLLMASAASAETQPDIVEHELLMDHGDGHLMDLDGAMVMGQNKDKTPGGCTQVSEDVELTVRAGHQYAKDYPGTMFGFDQHEWRVKPCARLTVHFINEDHVRHQWMLHGLPKYLYDKGMFHLEVTGPGKISGTLILPKEDKTYLVHCDIAQHMEKGMKGRLIVGKGSGTFPSIPGLTDPVIPDDYGPAKTAAASAAQAATPAPAVAGGTKTSAAFMLGVVLGLFGTPFLLAHLGPRFKGMAPKEVIAYLVALATDAFDQFVRWVHSLLKGPPRL